MRKIKPGLSLIAIVLIAVMVLTSVPLHADAASSSEIKKQINALKKTYNAREIYLDPANADLKRALDTLVDGTVETDLGMYRVFQQLVEGGNDQYFLLLDYPSYIEAKLKANAEYADRMEFGRKCMMNVASAAKFSSDRTIRQYAEEIWHINPTQY